MKNIIKTVFLTAITLSTISTQAQTEKPKESGGIYFLYVHMAEALTTEYKLEVKNRTFLNSYSESAIFPDDLLESVKSLAEKLCSEKLNVDVKCIYKTNKKGKKITSVGANNELEGMPSNTFKGAVSSTKHKYYIRIDVMMNTGGKSISFGNKKFSKIKPIVTAHLKIYDSKKNEVLKEKVTLKDFSKLRSTESTNGVVVETQSETLQPVDIYMIYERSLLELFK